MNKQIVQELELIMKQIVKIEKIVNAQIKLKKKENTKPEKLLFFKTSLPLFSKFDFIEEPENICKQDKCNFNKDIENNILSLFLTNIKNQVKKPEEKINIPPKKLVVLTNDEKQEINNYLQNLTDLTSLINLDKIELEKKEKFRSVQKCDILLNCVEVAKELNNLIGLDKIKQDIFKHICYYSNNLQKDEDLNHIIITGPPGVGKTELSKIIAKLYLKLGFLKNNVIKSFKRSDLIGKYLGETSIKTQNAIDSCIGGVMLIDEAYSLGSNSKNSDDIYSKECIDTLNRNLTENNNKFLCIIIGYEKNIENDILSKNEGLNRRFGTRFAIPSYSKTELFNIFCLKLAKWKFNDINYIKNKILNSNSEIFNFHAADMDILFKLIRFEYGLRIAKTIDEPDFIITNSDFDAAFTTFKNQKQNNNSVPFGLYI